MKFSYSFYQNSTTKRKPKEIKIIKHHRIIWAVCIWLLGEAEKWNTEQQQQNSWKAKQFFWIGAEQWSCFLGEVRRILITNAELNVSSVECSSVVVLIIHLLHRAHVFKTHSRIKMNFGEENCCLFQG